MNKQFVEVKWVDAVSHSSWQALDNLPEPMRVVTRGWLIADEPGHIVLASTFGLDESDEDVGGVWVIPRGMVTEITELGVSAAGKEAA